MRNSRNAIPSQEGRGMRKMMPSVRAEAWRISVAVIVPSVLHAPNAPVSSETGFVHHRTNNAIAREKFRRQAPRRSCVPRVIGFDRGDRCQSSSRVGEFEEPFTHRIEAAELRCHRHDRATGGKITDATIAKPAAFGSNVDVFGNRKLAARAAD